MSDHDHVRTEDEEGELKSKRTSSPKLESIEATKKIVDPGGTEHTGTIGGGGGGGGGGSPSVLADGEYISHWPLHIGSHNTSSDSASTVKNGNGGVVLDASNDDYISHAVIKVHGTPDPQPMSYKGGIQLVFGYSNAAPNGGEIFLGTGRTNNGSTGLHIRLDSEGTHLIANDGKDHSTTLDDIAHESGIVVAEFDPDASEVTATHHQMDDSDGGPVTTATLSGVHLDQSSNHGGKVWDARTFHGTGQNGPKVRVEIVQVWLPKTADSLL